MKIRHFLTLSIISVCFLITNVFAQTATFTAAQKQAIQQIVHDYLVKNPQVLVEASQALQDEQFAQMKTAAITAAKQNTDALLRKKDDIVKGNVNGTITLVEFFDYQCPGCRAMEPVLENIINANPDLRVVYKVYPIHGDDSVLGAVAAYAAYKQGKFSAFHDLVMKSEIPVNPTTVQTFAKKAGLNMKEFNDGLKTYKPIVQKQIAENMALIQKLQLGYTPTFFVAKTDANANSVFEFQFGGMSQDDMQKMINAVKKS